MPDSAAYPTRVAIVGCGITAWEHLEKMLRQQGTTVIRFVIDPSDDTYNTFAEHFSRLGL